MNILVVNYLQSLFIIFAGYKANNRLLNLDVCKFLMFLKFIVQVYSKEDLIIYMYTNYLFASTQEMFI